MKIMNLVFNKETKVTGGWSVSDRTYNGEKFKDMQISMNGFTSVIPFNGFANANYDGSITPLRLEPLYKRTLVGMANEKNVKENDYLIYVKAEEGHTISSISMKHCVGIGLLYKSKDRTEVAFGMRAEARKKFVCSIFQDDRKVVSINTGVIQPIETVNGPFTVPARIKMKSILRIPKNTVIVDEIDNTKYRGQIQVTAASIISKMSEVQVLPSSSYTIECRDSKTVQLVNEVIAKAEKERKFLGGLNKKATTNRNNRAYSSSEIKRPMRERINKMTDSDIITVDRTNPNKIKIDYAHGRDVSSTTTVTSNGKSNYNIRNTMQQFESSREMAATTHEPPKKHRNNNSNKPKHLSKLERNKRKFA